MINYIKPLQELIGELKRLPGIGPRSAERIAYSILEMDKEIIENFSKILINVKKNIVFCPICYSITDIIPCRICSDNYRDKNLLCIVEHSKDVFALEKNSKYNGLYHVLEGSLSPTENIGPENLRIKELINRLNKNNFKEIIFALNPSIEGDVTSMYLKNILKNFNIKITRIAQGIPIGGELEFADEMTLLYAFKDRKELKTGEKNE